MSGNPDVFQYFPGQKSSLDIPERARALGAVEGEPWMLGTAAMDRLGEAQRRRAILAARFPEHRFEAPASFESRQRAATVATEPAIDAWRPTDPALLSGFDLGSFQYDAWPGQLVLPEVLVEPLTGANGAMTIEVPSWGDEHHVIPDANRPIGAGYSTVTTDPTTIIKKLDFFGLAAKKDIRIVNKASSFLNISAKHAALALRGVMLHREVRVRNLLLTTADYVSGHAVALTTEWDNASGDSKADFDSLFTTMLATNGIARELMTVTLTSYDSFDAALNDPTFISQRTSTLGVSPNTATLQELARYWRVRRVNVADCRAEISGTIQSLWGDNAVVHWAGDSTQGVDLANLGLEDFMGTPFVGGVFVGNPGIAQAPYLSRDGQRTETVWPVDAADVPWITSFQALGILTNVKE